MNIAREPRMGPSRTTPQLRPRTTPRSGPGMAPLKKVSAIGRVVIVTELPLARTTTRSSIDTLTVAGWSSARLATDPEIG